MYLCGQVLFYHRLATKRWEGLKLAGRLPSGERTQRPPEYILLNVPEPKNLICISLTDLALVMSRPYGLKSNFGRYAHKGVAVHICTDG